MSTTQPVMPVAGQRFAGDLTSDLPVLDGWSWPYVTIAGRADGPLATIIAGIHGCEYVSIHAAVRLARELDPDEVRGRILIVPIVNLPSFWERVPFVCPIDGINPNRIFPGKADGTFTEAMTHMIFQTCIAPSDAFIDLHGGDLVEELASFTGYASDAAPEVTGKARAMAEAFGLDYCIGRPQQIGPRSGLTHMVAARHGVAGVLAEAGGIGQLTMPDVDLLVAGTRRALQVAGNLQGEPDAPATRHISQSVTLFASVAGFWICDVHAGDEVRAGQRVGQIFSLLGDLLETIEAPIDGFVIYRTTSAAVRPDGLLVNIGS